VLKRKPINGYAAMTEDQFEQKDRDWAHDTLLPRLISGQLRLPEAGAEPPALQASSNGVLQ
jgi:hypothetical protein